MKNPILHVSHIATGEEDGLSQVLKTVISIIIILKQDHSISYGAHGYIVNTDIMRYDSL